MARMAADLDVGQYHVLCGGEIPTISRGRLIIPAHTTTGRIECDDGGQEQVVAAAWATRPNRMRHAISCSHVQQFERGVVDHGIPRSTPATQVPPRLLTPRLASHRHIWRLVGPLGWIAGDDEEAPRELARCRIVCRNIATSGQLRAGVADNDILTGDPGCARTGVVHGLPVDKRVHFPDKFAALSIDTDEITIKGCNVDV